MESLYRRRETSRKPAEERARRSKSARGQGVIADASSLNASCSFPGVLLHVLREAASPNSTNDTLAKVIERDPDLMVRLLRLANTAFYATRYDQIDESNLPVADLRAAVLRLGFTGVRNVVFTQGVCRLASDQEELGLRIIAHLLVVGELARGLALHRSKVLAEDAYFAGVAHDFGKLALLRVIPHDYFVLLQHCRTQGFTVLEVEWKHLAKKQPFLINHVNTCSELLRSYGLPDATVDAVTQHHDPIDINHPLGSPDASGRLSLAAIVSLANQVAYYIGFPDGASGRNPYSTPADELLEAAGLDKSAQKRLIRESIDRADEAMRDAQLPATVQDLNELADLERRTPIEWHSKTGVAPTLAEEYESCLTMLRLLRTRASVGIYDFSAHTGLPEIDLTARLDKLEEAGYIRKLRGGLPTEVFRAASRIHRDPPDQIIQCALSDAPLDEKRAA